jgi:AcrR family transcriptional regulator
MPRVSPEYRANRRAEIVSAAATRFAQDGFHATSMADVISASGLSAGAVYRYFKSKEEIIAAVAETVLETADAVFAELLADGATPSPAEAITHMVNAIAVQAQRDDASTDVARVAVQVWSEALRSPVIGERASMAYGRMREHCAEVACRWQAAGHLPADADPADVGAAMLGLAQGFVLQRLILRGTTASDYLAGMRVLLSSTS